ncbi:MAG TPA: hypothetical protein VGL64_00675, partial [Amycolatopsis sp.]
DDNPDWHACCSTRVSPTEANYVSGWANVINDGNNRKIVNITPTCATPAGRSAATTLRKPSRPPYPRTTRVRRP